MFIKKLRAGYNEAINSQIEFATKLAELWRGNHGKFENELENTMYTLFCESAMTLKVMLKVSSTKPFLIDAYFSRNYQQTLLLDSELIFNALVEVPTIGAITGNFEAMSHLIDERRRVEMNLSDVLTLNVENAVEFDNIWLYRNAISGIKGNYSEEEKQLLIHEFADTERQKFERLKKKFSQDQTEHVKYERTRIPENVRIEVWRRDQGKCASCESRENLEYDHIVPVSRGGSNTARNVELLCEDCNRAKGNRIQ